MSDVRFRKILIANRGEIAVRVARACRELGIGSVAVYSDADAGALHVREADEAYPIGGLAASESYLVQAAILDAARQAGADAIHPGYGFLAENADFAAACAAAGFVFIGPPPEAMRLMGDKVASKQAVTLAGVPTVPGYDGDRQEPEHLLAEAQRIGFPLLIKAAAGGGGRGMRTVRAAEEFGPALESAQREAQSAFGNGRVFLERYVERARHVEIQVFADIHGNCVHLGERECSVQRRHQKIIEESPSPALTPELRERMGAAAVAAARAAGYVNAGTVEFLVEERGEFFFLEMNTRLQVEHPVTESVTGVDLVRAQIRVAAGEPLNFTQPAQLRGHAIECRIYAEDAATGFLPSIGQLTLFEAPAGPGVRTDTGVAAGDTVHIYYDPMLAKLICSGETRAAAIERTLAALSRFAVLGVTTNVGFLAEVIAHSEFRAGRTFTDFLTAHGLPAQADPVAVPDAVLIAAATFATAGSSRIGQTGHGGGKMQADAMRASADEMTGRKGGSASDPWLRLGPWRPAGSGIEQCFRVGKETHTVQLKRASGDNRGWLARHGDTALSFAIERLRGNELTIRANGRTLRFLGVKQGTQWELWYEGQSYSLAETGALDLSHHTVGGAEETSLTAPMPGVVVKLLVAEGDHVEERQRVLVLEAMKMELGFDAPHSGTVKRLPYKVGDLVPAGATLLEIESAD